MPAPAALRSLKLSDEADGPQPLPALLDLQRRVEQFSPAIVDEIRGEILRVRLAPTTDEHLNANYKDGVITVECTPDFSSCFTDSVEHELAHHVYPDLLQRTKEKISKEIQKRLEMPDAKVFHDIQNLLDDLAAKRSHIAENAHWIFLCNEFLRSRGFMETIASLSAQAALSVDSVAIASAYEAYRSTLSQCTPENLAAAMEIVQHAIEETECLQKKALEAYHQGKVDANQECPATETQNNPLRTKDGFDKKRWGQAKANYQRIIDQLFASLLDHYSRLDHEGRLDSKWEGAVAPVMIEKMLQDISSGSSSIEQYTMLMGTASLSHDIFDEEQFCAAVDSLYDGYQGPVRTAPMKFGLPEPLLDALAGVEYKGQKIFAPQVKRYKASMKR